LVTEYLPGGDLYSLLQNIGSLEENQAKIYAFEIVSELRYLRQHGIIHRDLKPDNILVTKHGPLKLADFGLSRQGVNSNRQELQTAQSSVGTIDYVAPEIILNQGHTFTADYWSLGAILWEFVYGIPPFHGDTVQDTKNRIVLRKLTFPDDVPVSHELKDLIQRLLIMDPTKRLEHATIEDIVNHD
jgi:serine/threonine protein kinase